MRILAGALGGVRSVARLWTCVWVMVVGSRLW